MIIEFRFNLWKTKYRYAKIFERMKNMYTTFILLPYNAIFFFSEVNRRHGILGALLKLNLAYERSCENVFTQSSEMMNEYTVWVCSPLYERHFLDVKSICIIKSWKTRLTETKYLSVIENLTFLSVWFHYCYFLVSDNKNLNGMNPSSSFSTYFFLTHTVRGRH